MSLHPEALGSPSFSQGGDQAFGCHQGHALGAWGRDVIPFTSGQPSLILLLECRVCQCPQGFLEPRQGPGTQQQDTSHRALLFIVKLMISGT